MRSSFSAFCFFEGGESPCLQPCPDRDRCGLACGDLAHFSVALMLFSLFLLTVLALLANVCYCAAYLVDIPMQRSAICAVWEHRRWELWLVGTLFAVVVENYWIADEIYPIVR